METQNIVLEYLRVVLTWPPILLILISILIFNFKLEIKELLGRVKKIYGLEINQKEADPILQEENIQFTYQELEELKDDFNKKEGDIESLKESITLLLHRLEIYEFAYLNLFLVTNTKYALLWFYNQPNYSSTKENFVHSFQLVEYIQNEMPEKESIVNVLLQNQLLILENAPLLTVTEKGERLLKHIEFIS